MRRTKPVAGGGYLGRGENFVWGRRPKLIGGKREDFGGLPPHGDLPATSLGRRQTGELADDWTEIDCTPGRAEAPDIEK